jgi:hypothetical protein
MNNFAQEPALDWKSWINSASMRAKRVVAPYFFVNLPHATKTLH